MRDIAKLIEKTKKGTLSNPEIHSLLDYLNDREPGVEIDSLYQRIWKETPEVNNDIDSKWIYQQILSKITVETGSSVERESETSKSYLSLGNSKRFWLPLLRYAAVFVLAFALLWLFQPIHPAKESVSFANQFQRVVVPYGSKTKVELPDGSVVTLNSGSSLRYASNDFNNNKRNVLLEGEGFFEVKKDSSRPFYVNTPGTKVKVLGTTFNVKAYLDESTEEMTLVTGFVEIYAGSDIKEEEKPVMLKPNEKAVFVRSTGKISRLDPLPENTTAEPVKLETIKHQSNAKTEQIISWKDNRLIFDNESFSSLVVKLERWYDVKISVNYPELNNARFTGKFDKETVEQVFNALVTVTPFRYEIRKNQIIITKSS